MSHRVDPDGERLPVKLDATSNGEFEPIGLSATNRAANRLAHEWASENANRRGVSRRDAALIAILAGYGIGSAEAVALSTLMLSNVLFAGAVCALAFVVGPLARAKGDG